MKRLTAIALLVLSLLMIPVLAGERFHGFHIRTFNGTMAFTNLSRKVTEPRGFVATFQNATTGTMDIFLVEVTTGVTNLFASDTFTNVTTIFFRENEFLGIALKQGDVLVFTEDSNEPVTNSVLTRKGD